MTKTMGQTVYDIFGPNIGHSAASQIAALGEYALTDEYMEEIKWEAESDAEMARLYIKDHERTQEKEYLEYANQYSKDEREKLRLIEELMSARSLSKRMSLPDRLRAARQAARMTQSAVGSALDPQHTRKNVCKWEHGQTEPSLSTIEQLAAALGVTPCWLAFGCEETHGN